MGEQEWKVFKHKRTPSDVRKKDKRTAKRASQRAQTGEGRRQPPAARQEVAEGSATTPVAPVRAKQTNRPGESQGESKQRAEKATHTGPAHKRKRGKRGKKGRPAPGDRDKPPKRSRPDDTQTPPTKEAKRIKASTSVSTVKDAVTYADSVVLNDLFVAVMAEPFTDLTPDQVEGIKGTLETSIVDIASTPSASNVVPYWPSFRGKPFHSEGVLKLQCEDKQDVEWLKDTIATFVSPIPGTILVVKRQKDIPRRVKSAVLLPNCKDDIKTIQTVLTGQNKWYQVSRWSLYNAEHHEGDTPGTFLVLGIPVDQVPGILARGRRLCYKLGNAYIRFFGSTGKLQDLPPDPAETATTPAIPGAPSAEKQSESAGPDQGVGASMSVARRPSSAAMQSMAVEPMITQHSSAEMQRQDGTSACPLTTFPMETGDGDLEEDVAQLTDQDSPLETDEEVSSPLRSSSPH